MKATNILITTSITIAILLTTATLLMLNTESTIKNEFNTKITENNLTLIAGGVSPNVNAYVNHEAFFAFIHLNNITTIYNQGVYYYAYDAQTQVAYVTSIHWENYRQ